MLVRGLDQALADLEDIQDYLLERNPPTASHVVTVLPVAGQAPTERPYRRR